MKKTIITAIACILLSFSMIGFAKEYPETINTIYLKDGIIIKCDMGWVDGDTLYYRKYGGTIGIPLKRVDIDKTYERSKEREHQKRRAEEERAAWLGTFTPDELSEVQLMANKVADVLGEMMYYAFDETFMWTLARPPKQPTKIEQIIRNSKVPDELKDQMRRKSRKIYNGLINYTKIF